ncbi:MAG: TonB family protein [Candidatus Omnitrophica bacterium]|nr:TonB family protein [Candidatus Omnitrophota bacterium]
MIHTAGIFLLVASPWKRPSADIQDIFTVQIVDIPNIAVPKPEIPAEEKAVPPKPAPVQKPTVKKEPAAKEEPPPPREIPAFPAEKFRESLIAKTEKTGKDEPEKKTAASLPVKIEKLESSAIEITTLSAAKLTVPQWYLSMVRSRIKANWRVNAMLGARTSIVSFRLNKNGLIENVNLEKSSGNVSFDRSAVDAVRTAGQMPYFPDEIPGTHLDIIIDFKTEG